MSYKLDYEKRKGKNSDQNDTEELHREWYSIYRRFEPDSYGDVKVSDLRRHLMVPEVRQILPPDAITLILELADEDRNRKISYYEFINMVRAKKYSKEDKLLIRRAIRTAAATVVPKSDRRYLDEYSCSPPPLFMILISIAQIGIFIYYTLEFAGRYGIAGPLPISSQLIYDPHKKSEWWRYVTYMFVHGGIYHIVVNVFMQLVIGIPLEMVHKWWRVMIIYIAGVTFGSLCHSLFDQSSYLAGSSGGVYALMTAHLACIIMNWSEMEYGFLRLILFLITAASDIGVAVYYRISGTETRIGYTAHLAGAIAGLLIGINVLRNLRKRTWEKIIWWVSLLLVVSLFAIAISWNIKPWFEFKGF